MAVKSGQVALCDSVLVPAQCVGMPRLALFYASVVYARKRTCASVAHQAGFRSRLLSSGETEFPVGESVFKYVWFVYEQ